MTPLTATTAVAVLGLITTKVVDGARQLDPNDSAPKFLWLLLAWFIGIGICLIWQINALTALGTGSRLTGVTGQVLTGFLTAARGSAWHEALDNMSAGAKAKNVAASLDPHGHKTADTPRALSV